jgi:hypothetical protein
MVVIRGSRFHSAENNHRSSALSPSLRPQNTRVGKIQMRQSIAAFFFTLKHGPSCCHLENGSSSGPSVTLRMVLRQITASEVD